MRIPWRLPPDASPARVILQGIVLPIAIGVGIGLFASLVVGPYGIVVLVAAALAWCVKELRWVARQKREIEANQRELEALLFRKGVGRGRQD